MIRTSDAEQTVVINGKRFVLYLDESAIIGRIDEMAEVVTHQFRSANPVFLGVLTGAFMFFSDLVRRFDGDCDVDFIKLESYGMGMESAGSIRVTKEPDIDLTGRVVIVVEDIVDTGNSAAFIKSWLGAQQPERVFFMTLLHKPDATQHPVEIDLAGFVIPSKFVIGYGLDFARKARNLPCVYILENGEGTSQKEKIT